MAGRWAWRLFGRVLRTLGGKNVGKCRLRAHQHPLSPPLSNLLEPAPCKTSKARRVPGDVLLHASILDFRPSLGNRCMLFPVYPLFRASILKFKPRLANRCSTIVVAVENSPPAAAVAATNSAADSNYIAAKKNGPPATTSLLHGRTARLQNERCGRRRGLDATKAA